MSQILPDSFGKKLVLLKLTRVTCLFTTLSISQEPSVIAGQFLDAVICWGRMLRAEWRAGEEARYRMQTAFLLGLPDPCLYSFKTRCI